MYHKNEHFRHILLFTFRKGKNRAQAAKELRDVYGEGALKDRKCRNWFDKFRSGDFLLKMGNVQVIYILSKKYRELVNKTQTVYYSSNLISSPSK